MSLCDSLRWALTIRLLRCVAALVSPLVDSLSSLIPPEDSDHKRL